MTTNWKVGDKLIITDRSMVSGGECEPEGHVYTVDHIYKDGTPGATCGMCFDPHEMKYVSRVDPSHDNVRAYFEDLVAREEASEDAGFHGGQHRQGWQSVKHTLNLLGIQIEGVNSK